MDSSTKLNLLDGSGRSSKRIIIMCGYPGSGKTTTAHRIRLALGDTYVVSRDYFRNPYRGSGSLDAFSYDDGEIVDRRFFAPIEDLLSSYTTLILDATFREYIKRQTAIQFAHKHGCQAFFIECICSYEVLISRLRQQICLGQKSFIRPPDEVLKFYIEHTHEPKDRLDGASFLRLDTEKNRVVKQFLQDQSCEFVKRLTEIFKQPFSASRLEPFTINSSQLSQPNKQSEPLNYFDPPKGYVNYHKGQRKDLKSVGIQKHIASWNGSEAPSFA